MIDPEDTDPDGGFEQDDEDEDGGFLARWSRRKQAGYQSREHPSAAGPQTGSGEATAADDSPQAAAQRELTDADMPPVDSLDEKSDYAAFMSPGISEKLRSQALHKLFHLPGFHVPDGLDDYDDDFTQFAKLGNIVTREMERMLIRERRAADAEAAVPEPGQMDVDCEADAEKRADAGKRNDTKGTLTGAAEDAVGDGDTHNEQV